MTRKNDKKEHRAVLSSKDEAPLEVRSVRSLLVILKTETPIAMVTATHHVTVAICLNVARRAGY